MTEKPPPRRCTRLPRAVAIASRAAPDESLVEVKHASGYTNQAVINPHRHFGQRRPRRAVLPRNRRPRRTGTPTPTGG